LYNSAYALLPKIPTNRVSFYQAHVCTQIGIQRFGAVALNYFAQGIQQYCLTNSTTNSIPLMRQSLIQLELLFSEERKAETGKWRGIYMFDKLTGFQNARFVILQLISQLTQQSVPYVTSWSSEYYDFTDYQLSVPTHYPLFYNYNSSNEMEWAVRVNCASTGCINTPVGGNFTTDEALVSMYTLSFGVIRYTLDGTDPTVNSPIYTDPITISNTSNYINARLYSGNTDYLVSRTKFFKNSSLLKFLLDNENRIGL